MKRFLLFLAIILTYHSYAQTKAQKIDSILTMLHKQSQFNGNILIVNEGKEVLKKSYGLANRETKARLNENSIFELASVSKQFTAMGIVLLKRQDKLTYSDKITKYLPELDFCKNVSIENLLNHSSGIPEYFGLMMENWDRNKIATNEDVIQILSEKIDTLNFTPNEKFEYSNTNYLLLASIIERISNKSYADFMKANIFEPLKMKNSFIYTRRYRPQKTANYALGYVMDDNQNIVIPDSLEYLDFIVFLDGIVGDGTVNSTINDLRKWDKSLRNHTLIGQKEFDYIKTLDTLNNGEINTYSLGWIFKQKNNDITMSHAGGWPGYVSYISRDVENENLIVILQNFDEIILPIKPIKEILKGEPISVSYKKEVQLPDSFLMKYVGKYTDNEDSTSVTSLTLGKNSLIFNSTNNPWNMPFYPDSKNTFFSKRRGDIGFEFKELNGHIKLIFLQDGKKIGESIKN